MYILKFYNNLFCLFDTAVNFCYGITAEEYIVKYFEALLVHISSLKNALEPPYLRYFVHHEGRKITWTKRSINICDIECKNVTTIDQVLSRYTYCIPCISQEKRRRIFNLILDLTVFVIILFIHCIIITINLTYFITNACLQDLSNDNKVIVSMHNYYFVVFIFFMMNKISFKASPYTGLISRPFVQEELTGVTRTHSSFFVTLAQKKQYIKKLNQELVKYEVTCTAWPKACAFSPLYDYIASGDLDNIMSIFRITAKVKNAPNGGKFKSKVELFFFKKKMD
ncbi:hypothetical protein RFI_36032 [Reticulomyxa filosa]|uniref:Uncharacterized protein n=1 Tax=Reticulomyxa filosa TaxID=46433 RepID=X6LHJ9_RETFI|nr:hypothetical protein RFI_36032 [Reticulomyxa filosa]|eukprot:ETO01408.1 hypothetical protein RFI_36032 [Reticulomyxa filosa]